MKEFFKNIFLFLLINFLIIFILLYYIFSRDNRTSYKQYETESVLYSTGNNSSCDLLIMGSSHGRMFSRGKNHLNVEKILNKKIINISKTAAGPVPELEFLKYFYDKGNKTKEIWYIIDPYIFYSEKWNEGLFFLTDEPFRFDFFSQIFFSGISTDVKYNYIKSKFSNDWIVNKASRLPDTEVKLYKTDTSAVAKRIKTEYPSGLKKEIFIKYSEELYKILEYSNNKKIKITFIIPPTLLGKVPGMNEMKIYLKDIEKKFHTKYYDYADSLLNPEFYYNHDHLNNAGIEALTKQFLTKIIKN